MPALDRCHAAVRNALIKDGWTIAADPLSLQVGDYWYFVDLAADRMIAADRGAERIAVEIKSFGGTSATVELRDAIGQYQMYRKVFALTQTERDLYLAIPMGVLDGELALMDVWKLFLVEDHIKVIGFDPDDEEIVSWQP